MKMTFDIDDYIPENGIQYAWEDGFNILVEGSEELIRIKADKAGLISLAKQLLFLANDDVPSGFHLHYDDSNSLEDGSSELVIEKM